MKSSKVNYTLQTELLDGLGHISFFTGVLRLQEIHHKAAIEKKRANIRATVLLTRHLLI